MEQISTEVIKTQTELCKEEIEAVMIKYPTCTLNIIHTIQVQEIIKNEPAQSVLGDEPKS